MSQAKMFFRLASEFRAAMRAGSPAAVAEAVDELAAFWLHAGDAGVRQRSATILEAHGMAGALEVISAQWAAE